MSDHTKPDTRTEHGRSEHQMIEYARRMRRERDDYRTALQRISALDEPKARAIARKALEEAR